MFVSAASLAPAVAAAYGLEDGQGFETIDGEFISGPEGEAALRNGMAVLIGGLLVSVFAAF